MAKKQDRSRKVAKKDRSAKTKSRPERKTLIVESLETERTRGGLAVTTSLRAGRNETHTDT